MTEQLRETYEPGFAFSEATVDRDAGLIENVSLLGAKSKNGYVYSRKALEQTAKLHKNVGVYLDHPTEAEEKETDGVRSVRDMAGQVVRARVDGDRVRGTIKILRGTVPGETLLALAEQLPGAVGFSHRADGLFNEAHDVVEDVTAVDGADIVTKPATVQGLFESWRKQPTKPGPDPRESDVEFKDITLDELQKQRPDLITSVLAESSDATKSAEDRAELGRLREFKKGRELTDQAAEKTVRIGEKMKDAGLPDETRKDEDVREMLMDCSTEEAEDLAIGNLVKAFQLVEKSTGRKYQGPRLVERDPASDLDDGENKPVDGEALAGAFDTAFG